MRNNMRRSLLLMLGFWLATTISYSQDLPDNAAYKARIDSLNVAWGEIMNDWNKTIPPHFIKAMRLEKEAEEHPELRDSLLAVAAKERAIGESLKASAQEKLDRNQEERRALMDKYSLVFEDAFPYFILREQFTKDSLSALLRKSSAEIRHSATGKSLRKYIKNDQFSDGSRFRTFRCYDVNGKRFDWNLIKGKKVFLVHDGLWCMNHGMDNSAFRKYLEHLRKEAPDCIPLVIVNCEKPEDLREAIEKYGLQEFNVVSEFKKINGVLNWLYNDMATPTCHYIDEHGILVKTTEGIDVDYLEEEFLRIR